MSNHMNTAKGWLSTGLAFGKKNAPILMTGGGITLGWLAAYILWKQSRKAEQVIAKKEADLQSTVDISEDDDHGRAVMDTMKAHSELPKKDKVVIYLQYCWTAMALGIASTGLLIGAQKLSIDRLAEMYILTQFLEEKNGKQSKLIDKLKEKAGIKDNSKDMHELENDIIDEDYDKDEIIDDILTHKDEYEPGTALVIDTVTHARFRADVIKLTEGISEANNMLKTRRKKALKRRLSDAYYSSDNPWSEDSFDEEQFGEVYSTLDLEKFLQLIGEVEDDGYEDTRIGELLEFRYYGGGDLLKATQILRYREYLDPVTGNPAVIYLDYTEYLSPSSELMERNPI